MANFGVSFAPTGGEMRAGQGTNGGPRQRVQEAIRVLSLRLPKVVGGASIAPAPVLQASGMTGTAPNAMSLLQRNLQQLAPTDRPTFATPQAPPSYVTPTMPPPVTSSAPSVSGAAAGISPVTQAVMQMAGLTPTFGAPTPTRVIPGIAEGEQPPGTQQPRPRWGEPNPDDVIARRDDTPRPPAPDYGPSFPPAPVPTSAPLPAPTPAYVDPQLPELDRQRWDQMNWWYDPYGFPLG